MASCQLRVCALALILLFYIQDGGTCEFANIDLKSMITGLDGKIESSDPMNIDITQSESSSMKYTLKNITMLGMQDCEVIHMQCDEKDNAFQYHLNCPHIHVTLRFIAYGKFGNYLIDGDGDGIFVAKNYVIMLNGKYKKFLGTDRKARPVVKEYSIDIDPRGGVTYNGTNIVRNDMEMDAKILKFINENWRKAEMSFRSSLINKFVDKFVENLNSYTKIV